MATILQVIQNASKRCGLLSPGSVVGSTNNNTILMLTLLEQSARDRGSEYPYGELQREYTFTLATSTANYAIPGDFDRTLNETLWNRTQHWPLIGPVDPVLWQQYKSGLITTLPRQRFRLKGWETAQFYIDPTPSSSENGQTCVYEYVSSTVFRPRTWVTSTAFAAGSYCSYNGNIYSTVAGGTTGANAPTVTSGSVSDGAVTWVYFSGSYDTVLADTDVPILDAGMMEDDIVWRYKLERGLDYEQFKQEADAKVELAQSKLTGAGVVSINGANALPWAIGYPYSYPEGNY